MDESVLVKTGAWKLKFPPEGPSSDAPLKDRQLFLRMRHGEILREARARLAEILKRRAEPTEKEKAKGCCKATTAFAYDLGGWVQQAASERSILVSQAKMLRAGVAVDRRGSPEDIDAVATALCGRFGLRWDAQAELESKKAEAAVSADDDCPVFDAPPEVKVAWFKKAFAQVKRYSDRLGALDIRGDRTMKEIVRAGFKIMTVMQHSLRDLSSLSGVTKDSKDVVRAEKAAVDDLETECIARQRTAQVADFETIRLETVQGVVEDVKKARAGFFPAYERLVGFAQTTEKGRMPFEITPAHDKMLRERLSHLRCRGCGEWHTQEWVPKYDPKTEKHAVLAVICPHCGLENCAGQQNHRIAAPREMGKSELVGKVTGVYDYSLLLYRGYRPEYVIIGSNKTEAKKRLGKRVALMRLPGHRLAFPMAVPAPGKAGAESVKIRGEDAPSISCCGIESLSPGIHADIIDCDDVVNEKNTFTHPGLMEMVQSKVVNVIDYSKRPWTLLNWYTTVWRTNDADDKLEQYATANPDQWTNCVIAVTGTPPTGDSPGNFISPWPNRWSPAALDAMYLKDAYAFRRAMMMQRVSDADVVFERVGLWVRAEDPKVARATGDALDGCPRYTRAYLDSLPRVFGIDLAYTDAKRETKGRSKTGFCIAAIDPATKVKIVLYSSEEFLKPGNKPGQVEAEILRLARDYRVTLVAIELDKAVTELCESLRAQGLAVVTYSPAALGSKVMRKTPVAGWFNNDQAYVQGTVVWEKSTCKVIPTTSHGRLRDHMLAFPAACPDDLDAAEIALRVAEEHWGGTPIARQQTTTGAVMDEMMRWRNSMYEDRPQRTPDESPEPTHDEALIEAIDRDLVFAADNWN